MQKKFLYGAVFLGLILSSCHTAKRAQHAVSADTVNNQSPAVKLKPVDSIAILKQQLADSINAPLNFSTFYGKAKATLTSAQASGSATVYIRMRKDSIIWISITGPLNIEGVRALITPDSVKIINKLENTLQLSSIQRLQQITKLPITFDDFQNILIGRPLLKNGGNAQYKVQSDSITMKLQSDVMNSFFTFAKTGFLLGQSNFQPLNNTKVSSANIFYSDYQQTVVMPFSASRDIAVAGALPASLQLNFREFNFNQPQSFVFTISKNYTIKYE